MPYLEEEINQEQETLIIIKPSILSMRWMKKLANMKMKGNLSMAVGIRLAADRQRLKDDISKENEWNR